MDSQFISDHVFHYVYRHKNKTHLKKSCKSVQVLLFQSISLPRSNQTLLLNVTIIAESQLCLYRESAHRECERHRGDMDVFAEETNSGSLFTCKRTTLNWNSVAWLKCFVTHRKKKKSQSVFRNIEAKKMHTNTRLCDNFHRREVDTNIKAWKFILASQSASTLPWVSKKLAFDWFSVIY